MIASEIPSPDFRIDWDDKNKKDVENAKILYQRAKFHNRKMYTDDGKEVEYFKPSLLSIFVKAKELDESEFAMRIHDETGDRRLVWDSRKKVQVVESAKLFQEYITKGWRAYAVDKSGKRGLRIHSFDGEQEEITFEDNTIKEKLSGFIKKFSEVRMVPRTYPG